jgi:hypothetical protein
MARIFSIHEYDLRPGASAGDFERATSGAEARSLFEIPGLTSHHFLRGLKGDRTGCYAALWVYGSRESWERAWGTAERPISPKDYPAGWRRWEEILAPFVERPADAIRFTAYEEISR